MQIKAIGRASIRIVAGSVVSLLFTAIAFRLHFNLSAATSLHLLLVVVLALRWGFLEASLLSIVSVICLDYFFTEPLFAFYMVDSHDWVALITFESVALLVGRLSDQLRSHDRATEMHRSRLQRLYELSRDILRLDQRQGHDQQLADLIRDTLDLRGVAIWNAHQMLLSKSGDYSLSEEEIRSTYFTETDEDDPDRDIARRVLRTGTRATGVLILIGGSLDNVSIQSVASLAAVALERTHAFQAQSAAEAARQSEQLRSAVLDGLAHAFKTPLTTIRTASSGLLEMNTLPGTEKRLVTLIDRHAGDLNDLSNRLLRTAKLDNVDLKLKRESIELMQCLQSSIETASKTWEGRTIQLHAETHQALVRADSPLLQMSIFQLLDNAAKYGSPSSPISVTLKEDSSEILISVHNEGSFISSEERTKIFQRFYRCPGSSQKVSGTGLGLSIVKRITEAHHGRVWVTSDPLSGTTFFMALPRTNIGR